MKDEKEKQVVVQSKAEIQRVDSKSPVEMIIQCVGNGVGIEQIGKLLEYQKIWDDMQAKKAYHVAMSAFKANAPQIVKDKSVAYKEVKYNHASLHNVTSVINKALSEHGLSASWQTAQNGSISVTCKITHMLGHSEQTTISAQSDATGSKNSIQAIGSTITYLERYTLLALTGLATADMDDDGRGSEPAEYIDEKQLSSILDYLDDKDLKIDRQKFLAFFKVESVEKLPKKLYNQVIITLETRKNQKGQKNDKS